MKSPPRRVARVQSLPRRPPPVAVPPSLKPSSETSRQQPGRCRRRARRRRPARECLPSPALLLVVHGRALIYMYNCAFPARRSSERVAPRLRPGRALVVWTRLRGALLSLISTQAAARGRAAVAKALVRDVEAAARSLPTPSSPSTPSAGMFTFAGPSSSGARSRPYIYVQLRVPGTPLVGPRCPHTAAL